jgi:hypothetical protein
LATPFDVNPPLSRLDGGVPSGSRLGVRVCIDTSRVMSLFFS